MTPMNPGSDILISIITVCYNETVERVSGTFDNIINQTYRNIEWIVVDGGSCSTTLDAIYQYREHIDCLISEPDDGPYYAMNKGIGRANGDFIILRHVGDSFVANSTVSDVVDVIRLNPEYECYHGDMIVVDDDGCDMPTYPKSQIWSKSHLYYGMYAHPSMFAARSVFDLIGGFDTRYRISADRDWIIRAIEFGARGLHVKCVISRHHMGISGNEQLRCQEDLQIRQERYSLPSRVMLILGSVLKRIVTRLRTGNFAVPVLLSDAFSKLVRGVK